MACTRGNGASPSAVSDLFNASPPFREVVDGLNTSSARIAVAYFY